MTRRTRKALLLTSVSLSILALVCFPVTLLLRWIAAALLVGGSFFILGWCLYGLEYSGKRQQWKWLRRGRWQDDLDDKLHRMEGR